MKFELVEFGSEVVYLLVTVFVEAGIVKLGFFSFGFQIS